MMMILPPNLTFAAGVLSLWAGRGLRTLRPVTQPAQPESIQFVSPVQKPDWISRGLQLENCGFSAASQIAVKRVRQAFRHRFPGSLDAQNFFQSQLEVQHPMFL